MAARVRIQFINRQFPENDSNILVNVSNKDIANIKVMHVDRERSIYYFDEEYTNVDLESMARYNSTDNPRQHVSYTRYNEDGSCTIKIFRFNLIEYENTFTLKPNDNRDICYLDHIASEAPGIFINLNYIRLLKYRLVKVMNSYCIVHNSFVRVPYNKGYDILAEHIPAGLKMYSINKTMLSNAVFNEEFYLIRKYSERDIFSYPLFARCEISETSTPQLLRDNNEFMKISNHRISLYDFYNKEKSELDDLFKINNLPREFSDSTGGEWDERFW